jgi:hypothetical protein
MKHLIITFMFFALGYSFAGAQDTIVLNNGQKILAIRIHFRQKLFYKHYGGFHGGWDSINKSEVKYVGYATGREKSMVSTPWYSSVIISPGIGLSAIQYNFKDIITDTGANIVSFSPVYSLNIDYAPTSKFSFGIGVAWQTLKINPYISYHDTLHDTSVSRPNSNYYAYYPNYPYGTALHSSVASAPPAGGPNAAVTERLTRFNVGLRLLYHFRNDNAADIYAGARIGLSFWTDQSNPEGFYSHGSYTATSIQAFMGLRKTINSYLGAYIEGGIGTPYFIDLGLYYKFNTVKKSSH